MTIRERAATQEIKLCAEIGPYQSLAAAVILSARHDVIKSRSPRVQLAALGWLESPASLYWFEILIPPTGANITPESMRDRLLCQIERERTS